MVAFGSQFLFFFLLLFAKTPFVHCIRNSQKVISQVSLIKFGAYIQKRKFNWNKQIIFKFVIIRKNS